MSLGEKRSLSESSPESTWKCSDPGCNKVNECDEAICKQCKLPQPTSFALKKRGSGHDHNKRGRSWDRREGSQWQERGGRKLFGDKEGIEGIDESSPIVQKFHDYAKELDCKHDKYERIVKLSRDITIESKRIIFLLHRVDGSNENKSAIMPQAKSRLSQLQQGLFKCIAYELQDEDHYNYLRAYTNGLQEYVEALTFYYYLLNDSLVTCEEVQKDLIYMVKDKSARSAEERDDRAGRVQQKEEVSEDEGREDLSGQKLEVIHGKQALTEKGEVIDGGEKKNPEEIRTGSGEVMEVDMTEKENKDRAESGPTRMKQISILVPPTEYVLGVADLTGELMRKCINSLGVGKVESCFHLSGFVRNIHDGFLTVGNLGTKEVTRKMWTLKQSLQKIENACYTIQVRGSEIPRHMLADMFSSSEEPQKFEEDFY